MEIMNLVLVDDYLRVRLLILGSIGDVTMLEQLSVFFPL